MEREVTPEAILQKLSMMKAKMIELIRRWEQSGNGDGQREEMDSEFGQTRFVHHINGDNRASFLWDSPSHVLYLWHLMDLYDLLNDLKETLHEDVQATGTSAPTTARAKRRRGGQDDRDRDSEQCAETQHMFMDTFQNLGMKEELSSIRQTISALGNWEMTFQAQLLALNREKRQAPDQATFIQEDIDIVRRSKADVTMQIERYQQEEAGVAATIQQNEEQYHRNRQAHQGSAAAATSSASTTPRVSRSVPTTPATGSSNSSLTSIVSDPSDNAATLTNHLLH
jgi:hypothetical protein